MGATEDSSNGKTVEELRAEARRQGVRGASSMRKADLLDALADGPAGTSASRSLRTWARDRSLGIFFVSIFLSTWLAQLFFEWQVYVHEEQEHGSTATLWSTGFWSSFWQSTLENWQSEFLQLAAFTIAAAYFVFKGSAESPDSSERIESKLDALMRQLGVDPAEVESQLPLKHRKTR